MASGSSHDLRHQRRRLCQVYLEEHADSSGKVVKTERTWFYDYRALDSISPNIRWPLERITDDAACAPREDRRLLTPNWSGGSVASMRYAEPLPEPRLSAQLLSLLGTSRIRVLGASLEALPGVIFDASYEVILES